MFNPSISFTEAIFSWAPEGYQVNYRKYTLEDVSCIESYANGELKLLGGKEIMVQESHAEIMRRLSQKRREQSEYEIIETERSRLGMDHPPGVEVPL